MRIQGKLFYIFPAEYDTEADEFVARHSVVLDPLFNICVWAYSKINHKIKTSDLFPFTTTNFRERVIKNIREKNEVQKISKDT